jgi:hypothetical protein
VGSAERLRLDDTSLWLRYPGDLSDEAVEAQMCATFARCIAALTRLTRLSVSSALARASDSLPDPMDSSLQAQALVPALAHLPLLRRLTSRASGSMTSLLPRRYSTSRATASSQS